MTTMVERMARAIAGSRYIHLGGADAQNMVKGTPNWVFCRRDALLALRAMREPTESMLDAGESAFSIPDAIGAGDAWQAMIDQAVKEAEA